MHLSSQITSVVAVHRQYAMIIDLLTIDDAPYGHVGGKGYNLHRLYRAGLPVPRAIVIRPHAVNVAELSAKLEMIDWLRNGKSFAVRSSGVGEDSQDRSWAGIFDSYLFVESQAVAHYVQKVIDSMKTSRYEGYAIESGAEINSMAVIVQEMIDADYAGVAFTTSPIENDHRIALIEIVEGVGESLVSSRKTPATVRVNKVTNMARIQQAGDDNIDKSVLLGICDVLMPYLYKIEELYGRSMDVEWAVRNNQIFILQARPVTTT